MPPPPLPPELDEFLRLPNPAVIASLRPDGAPHTAATWYDRDGRCALTALAHDDRYRHVSLLGAVEEWQEDADLAGIDGLSIRYTGRPYRNRKAHRIGAWIAVDAWHVWDSHSVGTLGAAPPS